MATLLRILGALLIIAWLVLYLGIKLAFGAVHLLLVVGVVLLLLTLFSAKRTN